MNDFVASNGVIVAFVSSSQRWTIDPLADGGDYANVTEAQLQALREFFQAEDDERLGRWRWPDNPDYVVYSVGAEIVDVLRESSVSQISRGPGRQEAVTRAAAEEWDQGYSQNFFRAARAYFDAHPEPKPWHDAAAGEVWLLTFSEEGGGGREPWTVDRTGLFAHPLYSNNVARLDTTIVDGTRIWPAEVS